MDQVAYLAARFLLSLFRSARIIELWKSPIVKHPDVGWIFAPSSLIPLDRIRSIHSPLPSVILIGPESVSIILLRRSRLWKPSASSLPDIQRVGDDNWKIPMMSWLSSSTTNEIDLPGMLLNGILQ